MEETDNKGNQGELQRDLGSNDEKGWHLGGSTGLGGKSDNKKEFNVQRCVRKNLEVKAILQVVELAVRNR